MEKQEYVRRKFIGDERDFEQVHTKKTTEVRRRMSDRKIVSISKNHQEKSVQSSALSELKNIKAKKSSQKNLNKYNFQDLN